MLKKSRFQKLFWLSSLCAVVVLGVATTNAQPQKIRLGLGYLPDVQFAPFYLAQTSGLYAKRGLEVEFQHGFTSELYPLLAQGKLDFVVGDAEDVVLLRSKDAKAAPFKFVMAMYQDVPNVLFSRVEKNIRSIKDLKGKTIGIPGLYGTSWTSLQAVMRAAKLSENDVKIEQIGFNQVEAILANRVDVALGFVNNEPVVLGARGIKLNVIAAAPYNRSPGNGVLTTDARLKDSGLVKGFLAASQESLATIIANPKLGFEAAKTIVPNLSEDRINVLNASLPLYQSNYSKLQGLGFSNPNGWQKLLDLLVATGRVAQPLARNQYYTNQFLTPKLQAK